MEKFIRITATACPIPAENIDTDQILPARYLKLPRKGEHGKVLFHDLRFDAAGNERPDFPLNRPDWRDSAIIVAGRNFGGGSSREGLDAGGVKGRTPAFRNPLAGSVSWPTTVRSEDGAGLSTLGGGATDG